jgi:hypothetical protein
MKLLQSLIEGAGYENQYSQYDLAELQRKHQELQKKKDDTIAILRKAKEITKNIKYNDTVSDIIVGLTTLVEENKLDSKSFNIAVNDVRQANNALESAVYKLEEVFTDQIRALSHQMEIIEDILDERGMANSGNQ